MNEQVASSWFRKFGDPTDEDRYITLEEVNDALELVDELKPLTAPDGELAEFFGLHPPSFFDYAGGISREEHIKSAATGDDAVQVGTTLWMDGLLVGMAIMLTASAHDD